MIEDDAVRRLSEIEEPDWSKEPVIYLNELVSVLGSRVVAYGNQWSKSFENKIRKGIAEHTLDQSLRRINEQAWHDYLSGFSHEQVKADQEPICAPVGAKKQGNYQVYYLYFPSGELFIGWTGKLEKIYSTEGLGLSNPFVHERVRKYGWENIRKKILVTHIRSASEAKICQIKEIERYNSGTYGINKWRYRPCLTTYACARHPDFGSIPLMGLQRLGVDFHARGWVQYDRLLPEEEVQKYGLRFISITYDSIKTRFVQPFFGKNFYDKPYWDTGYYNTGSESFSRLESDANKLCELFGDPRCIKNFSNLFDKKFRCLDTAQGRWIAILLNLNNIALEEA